MIQKSTLYNMGTQTSENHTLKVANGTGQKLELIYIVLNLIKIKYN